MTPSILKPLTCALALVLGLTGTGAFAQETMKLEGKAQLILREIDNDGNVVTRLAEPATVVPGDRILFTTTYENVTDSEVTNFVVTNPLPSAVQLAANADPALIVSVDGGVIWGQLGTLTISDGADMLRPARPSDVTHIQWVIPQIAPLGSGRVEYVGEVR